MLDAFGPTVLMHCSQNQLTLQRRSRFGRSIGAPVVRCLPDQAQSIEKLLQQLRSGLSEFACKSGVIDMVMSDAWCRLFFTTPPSNTAHRSDCHAAVVLRFQSLYGESAADWVLRADWQVAAPFITVAMPRKLHDGLLNIASTFKLRVARIAPDCIAAWNRWSRAVAVGDWFAQMNGVQLTLMVLDGPRLHHIVQQPLDDAAQHDPDWLTRFVQREALRLNLSAPVRIACAGQVPSAWSEKDPARLTCHVLAEKNRSASTQHASAVSADTIQ